MEKRLGELLIEDQIIHLPDLELALRKQAETGISLGRILIDMGKASEWEVAATLGKQLNVPAFRADIHFETHLVDEELANVADDAPVVSLVELLPAGEFQLGFTPEAVQVHLFGHI